MLDGGVVLAVIPHATNIVNDIAVAITLQEAEPLQRDTVLSTDRTGLFAID